MDVQGGQVSLAVKLNRCKGCKKCPSEDCEFSLNNYAKFNTCDAHKHHFNFAANVDKTAQFRSFTCMSMTILIQDMVGVHQHSRGPQSPCTSGLEIENANKSRSKESENYESIWKSERISERSGIRLRANAHRPSRCPQRQVTSRSI